MDFEKPTTHSPKSHFLDSGAFSLHVQAKQYARKHGCSAAKFYRSKSCRKYLDQYAAFIKKCRVGVDLYANVDVIGDPELTWRNQQYLEQRHGLKPVPVIHYKEGMKWVKHYVDGGYTIIGFGGMVDGGFGAKQGITEWLDHAFAIVCDADGMPQVKVHGFGMTGFRIMSSYPWWSVDSAGWTKAAANGQLLVPPRKNGEFRFDRAPMSFGISGSRKNGADLLDVIQPGRHADDALSRCVQKWLEHINIPFGEQDEQGNVIEKGVSTHYVPRAAANLLYYQRLADSLPKWPWKFQPTGLRSLGVL